MSIPLGTSRIRQIVAAAALLALSVASGCRFGYDMVDPSGGAPSTGATGKGGSAGHGGVSSGAGGASGASGAQQISLGGCTLQSNGGVAYQVGDVAKLTGFHLIRSISSGNCLQTAGCLVAVDAAYEQATCSNEACQIFQSVERDDGWYSLQNVSSGYCLDAGGNLADDALHDGTCVPAGHSDEARESFQVVCDGGDSWRLVNRATQAYVGVAKSDAGVDFRTQLGGDEQRFTVDSRASVFHAILPTSEADPGTLWRYVSRKPRTGWERPTFDDRAWLEGPGGFGDGLAISSPTRTPWTDAEIWLRRSFTLATLPSALHLRINHDFKAEVYINGIEVAALPTWTSGYRVVPLNDSALANFTLGENTIAVHCTADVDGEQFIDVGLGTFGW